MRNITRAGQFSEEKGAKMCRNCNEASSRCSLNEKIITKSCVGHWRTSCIQCKATAEPSNVDIPQKKPMK